MVARSQSCRAPAKISEALGRKFVNQDHQLPGFKDAFLAGLVFFFVNVGALRVHNQFVAGKKLVGNVHGLRDVAAAVAAQVQDQALHAAAFELFHVFHKLTIGRFGKLVQLQVARFCINHIGGIHGRKRNAAAGHVEILQPFSALDGKLHRAAGFAADQFANALNRKCFAHDGAVIDLNNLIAQ